MTAESEPPKRPSPPRGLWLNRSAVLFWMVLPLAMGYAGVTSLDHVADGSARSILGLFVLLGVGALFAIGHLFTKEPREVLKQWAFEKRVYRDLQQQHQRHLRSAQPPKQ